VARVRREQSVFGSFFSQRVRHQKRKVKIWHG
jgi:hypothetical protein